MDRTFSAPSRSSTPSREKKKITISSSDLTEIKKNFDDCIREIRDRFKYVDLFSMSSSSPDELCASQDLLRYQIVSLDSLLDYYIHQIVSFGLKKIFNDEWGKTEEYNKIHVPLETVEYAIQNPEDNSWIVNISDQHKARDTYMSYDSLFAALKIIGICIQAIVTSIGFTVSDFKQDIDNLYKRRNVIVHHSDMDATTHVKNSIGKGDVEPFIDLVEKLGNKIYEEVKNR